MHMNTVSIGISSLKISDTESSLINVSYGAISLRISGYYNRVLKKTRRYLCFGKPCGLCVERISRKRHAGQHAYYRYDNQQLD